MLGPKLKNHTEKLFEMTNLILVFHIFKPLSYYFKETIDLKNRPYFQVL